MALMIFMIGVLCGGFLVVVFGSSRVQGWQRSRQGAADIDRLVEQFQALFRQLDQDKRSRS